MNSQPLTETMKIWLQELYRDAAEEHRGTASNCHIVALGSDGESAIQFEEFADEHREFAEILETMAKELEG